MLLPNVDPDFSSRWPKPAGLRTSDARPAAPFGLHGVASDRGAQAPKKIGKIWKMCVTVELILVDNWKWMMGYDGQWATVSNPNAPPQKHDFVLGTSGPIPLRAP